MIRASKTNVAGAADSFEHEHYEAALNIRIGPSQDQYQIIPFGAYIWRS